MILSLIKSETSVFILNTPIACISVWTDGSQRSDSSRVGVSEKTSQPETRHMLPHPSQVFVFKWRKILFFICSADTFLFWFQAPEQTASLYKHKLIYLLLSDAASGYSNISIGWRTILESSELALGVMEPDATLLLFCDLNMCSLSAFPGYLQSTNEMIRGIAEFSSNCNFLLCPKIYPKRLKRSLDEIWECRDENINKKNLVANVSSNGIPCSHLVILSHICNPICESCNNMWLYGILTILIRQTSPSSFRLFHFISHSLHLFFHKF